MPNPTGAGVMLAADPGVQKMVAAAAGASGVATGWATAQQIALEIFGVPLPVVLACATAAYGALSFHSNMGYLKTLGAGAVWTMLGSAGAQLALFGLGKWLGGEIPAIAMSGAGVLISGFGALLLTRENVDKLRAAAGRRIDKLGGGGQ